MALVSPRWARWGLAVAGAVGFAACVPQNNGGYAPGVPAATPSGPQTCAELVGDSPIHNVDLVRARAALKAERNLAVIAGGVHKSVGETCAQVGTAIPRALGATGAAASPDCTQAGVQVRSAKQRSTGDIRVVQVTQHCGLDMDDFQTCMGKCMGKDAGQVEVQCRGGEVFGECDGNCRGPCSAGTPAGQHCSKVCFGGCDSPLHQPECSGKLVVHGDDDTSAICQDFCGVSALAKNRCIFNTTLSTSHAADNPSVRSALNNVFMLENSTLPQVTRAAADLHDRIEKVEHTLQENGQTQGLAHCAASALEHLRHAQDQFAQDTHSIKNLALAVAGQPARGVVGPRPSGSPPSRGLHGGTGIAAVHVVVEGPGSSNGRPRFLEGWYRDGNGRQNFTARLDGQGWAFLPVHGGAIASGGSAFYVGQKVFHANRIRFQRAKLDVPEREGNVRELDAATGLPIDLFEIQVQPAAGGMAGVHVARKTSSAAAAEHYITRFPGSEWAKKLATALAQRARANAEPPSPEPHGNPCECSSLRCALQCAAISKGKVHHKAGLPASHCGCAPGDMKCAMRCAASGEEERPVRKALEPSFHAAARACAAKGLWAAAGLPPDGGDTPFRIKARIDGSGHIGKLSIMRGDKAGQTPDEAGLRLLLCLTAHTRAGIKSAVTGPGRPWEASLSVMPK